MKKVLAVSFGALMLVGVILAPKSPNYFNVAKQFISSIETCTMYVDRIADKYVKNPSKMNVPAVQKVVLDHSKKHCRQSANALASQRELFRNSPNSYRRIGKMIDILKYLEYENYGKVLVLSAVTYETKLRKARSTSDFFAIHGAFNRHVLTKINQYNKGIKIFKKTIPAELQQEADQFITRSNIAFQEVNKSSNRMKLAISNYQNLKRNESKIFKGDRFQRNFNRMPASYNKNK